VFWYSGMLLQPTLLGCVQVLYTLLAHVVQHPPSQLPVLHAELDQVINQRRMFTQNAHTHTHHACILQAKLECCAELDHARQVAETWRVAMSHDLDTLRDALEQVGVLLNSQLDLPCSCFPPPPLVKTESIPQVKKIRSSRPGVPLAADCRLPAHRILSQRPRLGAWLAFCPAWPMPLARPSCAPHPRPCPHPRSPRPAHTSLPSSSTAPCCTRRPCAPRMRLMCRWLSSELSWPGSSTTPQPTGRCPPTPPLPPWVQHLVGCQGQLSAQACTCTCTYIRTHTHVHTRTHTRVHTHTRTHVYTHARTHARTHTRMQVRG